MTDGVDRLITAGAQAWLGGVAALQGIQERVFREVLEAKTTEDPRVSDPDLARVSLLVGHDTTLGCEPLAHAGSGTTIPRTDIGLFPMAVAAGVPTVVTVSVRPDPTRPAGVYRGRLTDAAGVVLTSVGTADEKPSEFPVRLKVDPPAKPRPPA